MSRNYTNTESPSWSLKPRPTISRSGRSSPKDSPVQRRSTGKSSSESMEKQDSNSRSSSRVKEDKVDNEAKDQPAEFTEDSDSESDVDHSQEGCFVPESMPQTGSNSNSNSSLVLMGISIVLVIAVLVCFVASWYGSPQNSTQIKLSLEDTKKEIQQKLREVKGHFPQQTQELWSGIFTGISEVVEHPDSLSVVVLYSHERKPLTCLAYLVGKIGSHVVGSNVVKETEKVLTLTPDQLENFATGQIISRYREDINRTKVVVIENLLDLGPAAIKDFHSLCDRYGPVVKGAIYVITMVTEESDATNPTEFVERRLQKKLNGSLDRNIMDPLIARITDGVVLPVYSEPKYEACPNIS